MSEVILKSAQFLESTEKQKLKLLKPKIPCKSATFLLCKLHNKPKSIAAIYHKYDKSHRPASAQTYRRFKFIILIHVI